MKTKLLFVRVVLWVCRLLSLVLILHALCGSVSEGGAAWGVSAGLLLALVNGFFTN